MKSMRTFSGVRRYSYAHRFRFPEDEHHYSPPTTVNTIPRAARNGAGTRDQFGAANKFTILGALPAHGFLGSLDIQPTNETGY